MFLFFVFVRCCGNWVVETAVDLLQVFSCSWVGWWHTKQSAVHCMLPYCSASRMLTKPPSSSLFLLFPNHRPWLWAERASVVFQIRAYSKSLCPFPLIFLFPFLYNLLPMCLVSLQLYHLAFILVIQVKVLLLNQISYIN